MIVKSEFIRKLIRKLKRWIGGQARSVPPVERNDDGGLDHGVFAI